MSEREAFDAWCRQSLPEKPEAHTYTLEMMRSAFGGGAAWWQYESRLSAPAAPGKVPPDCPDCYGEGGTPPDEDCPDGILCPTCEGTGTFAGVDRCESCEGWFPALPRFWVGKCAEGDGVCCANCAKIDELNARLSASGKAGWTKEPSGSGAYWVRPESVTARADGKRVFVVEVWIRPFGPGGADVPCAYGPDDDGNDRLMPISSQDWLRGARWLGPLPTPEEE